MLETLRNMVPRHLPVVNYPDKTNADLLMRINSFLQEAVNQTATIAPHFKGGNEAKKVFDFLKNEIRYKADGDNQNILKPNALIIMGTGDCKSFTLFAAGILINLGHKVIIRFAGYNTGNLLNHVYCISDGVIVDAVWGHFNSEKPFQVKKDFTIIDKY